MVQADNACKASSLQQALLLKSGTVFKLLTSGPSLYTVVIKVSEQEALPVFGLTSLHCSEEGWWI